MDIADTAAITGARDMLREAAKQLRLLGDDSHATMCDRHRYALSKFLGDRTDMENQVRELAEQFNDTLPPQ